MLQTILALILAVPAVPQPADAPPLVQGKCQFGDIHQKGKNVAIVGGGAWQASGEWTGKLLVIDWLCVSSGRHGYAEYELKDGNLVDWWAWEEDVTVDEHGNMRVVDEKSETLTITGK